MDKKILLVLGLILLASIPLIVSIPQFLIFQGEVKIDGRPAPTGTIINFSVNNTELAHSFVNSSGQYGPVLIQGFEELYGKPINITIISSGKRYEAEQKINYVYPQDIYLNLSTTTEKALKISSSFPVNETISFQKTGTQTFNISATSGYLDGINYSTFLDGNLVSSSNSYVYVINNSDKRKHNITIIADDGFLSVSREWELIIERPETQSFDGSTTDFDSLGLNELGDIAGVVLEKTATGRIEFLENLNLTGVVDLNNRVKIERGIVAIDTSFYPNLNKKARITLTGLIYSTIPEIFYNDGFTTNPNAINKKCDFCRILNYTPSPTTKGVVVFEVEHFSSFMVGGSGIRYNLSLFDDLDLCKLGVQGNLSLKIKEPGERDKFGYRDKINVRADVTNNVDEKKKVIAEVSLYNINKDEVEEDTEGNKKIKDGKKESFELSLNIPNDFDEDDNYLVFVKTYEDDKEELQCNQTAVGVRLEREKDDVIIKEVSVNPGEVHAGEFIDLNLKIENIGKNDEDVYILAEISELNVSEKSESFELEEFGGRDSRSEMFSIKIPESAKEGEYNITIRAVFDGEEDEKKVTIAVLEKIPVERELIDLTIKKAPKISELGKPVDLTIKEVPKIEKVPKTRGILEIPPVVPVFLSIGIIILIILIIIVNARKR